MKLSSFIKVDIESHFPIQNIPFGIFRNKFNPLPRACTAIGEFVVDLALLERKGFFKRILLKEKDIFSEPSLNKFMSLGRKACGDVRNEIQSLFGTERSEIRDNLVLQSECIFHKNEIEMCMPVTIGDYTDFYSSKQHATNVGIMFRGKENALMPNWVHLPVAYHGRSSSVVLSGTNIIRPKGQTKSDDKENPEFGPSKLLDIELEMGMFVGKGNELGHPVSVDEAPEHVFGMVLVNDWSARDIQKWEYVPLGPFLGKNFATSISPWIVTLDALEPFKTSRVKQVPEPLEYLKSNGDWLYDIDLEVKIRTAQSEDSFIIAKSNFKNLYWDICQQIAHHTVNGCNLRTGDLLASGTISGDEKESFGSLLELTWRGTEPLKLPNGEVRKFLQDGDEITITGWCDGDGYKVGFGEVKGKILPPL